MLFLVKEVVPLFEIVGLVFIIEGACFYILNICNYLHILDRLDNISNIFLGSLIFYSCNL